MTAFWIFGKIYRLKAINKNAASKNTFNFAKNHPRKLFFAYISRTIRDIEKSPTRQDRARGWGGAGLAVLVTAHSALLVQLLLASGKLNLYEKPKSDRSSFLDGVFYQIFKMQPSPRDVDFRPSLTGLYVWRAVCLLGRRICE